MKDKRPLALDDCIFAALVNHCLTTLNSEARYLRSLRNKAPDEDILKEMLVEFRVWRTLGAEGKSRIVGNLPKISKNLQRDLSGQLSALASWENAFQETANWGHSLNDDTQRHKSFASGLTKALWFSGGHKAPMFDVFTCRALRIGSKERRLQVKEFYQKHEEYQFEELRKKIQHRLSSHCVGWEPFAERLIDKALLIRGVEATKNSTTPFHDVKTLESYRDTLGKSLGFSGLAKDIVRDIGQSKYAEVLEISATT